MRTSRAVLLVALSVSLLWPAAAGGESTLDTVKKRGKLVAGVRFTNPPFGYIDEKGQNAGFDVDLVRALAQKLGVGLELKEVTAQTRIPVLVNGGVDLAAAAVNHYIERDQVVDFTIPYLMVDVDGLFVVKKGGPLRTVKGFEDLAGKTLAIAQGAGAGPRFLKMQPTGKVLELQDWPAAVQALRQGKADFITTDSPVLYFFAAKFPNELELVGRGAPLKPMGIIVRENDSKWRDWLNVALIEMWEDCSYHQIYRHTFGRGPDPRFEMPDWRVVSQRKKCD